MLKLYDREFKSRLMVGSGLYPSPAIMQQAIRASGAGIVTVSLRRESAGGKNGEAFWSLIRELDVAVLPNTAGCRSVREAVTTAKLVGAVGVVTIPISLNGVGKIQCGACTEELIVRCDEEVPAGERVRIVENSGGVYLVKRCQDEHSAPPEPPV